MNTVESLKRSIHSAEDLGAVARTMKTLAAVNIRQYEAAVESLNEYNRTIRTGLRMLLQNGVDTFREHPIAGPHLGMIVFGSDQGMCGQFNEQIARFTAESISGDESPAAPVICIGQRAADSLAGAHVEVARVFSVPGSAEGMTPLVHDLLPAIDEWRAHCRVGRILVIFNRRQTASTWRPHVSHLLPLNLKQLRERPDADGPATGRTLPFWTMDRRTLFSRLIRQFLFVSLFRACAESQAGENASRIAAMQSAERNIKDRLQILRTEYAQIRQTTITEELLDVVTGFEALREHM